MSASCQSGPTHSHLVPPWLQSSAEVGLSPVGQDDLVTLLLQDSEGQGQRGRAADNHAGGIGLEVATLTRPARLATVGAVAAVRKAAAEATRHRAATKESRDQLRPDARSEPASLGVWTDASTFCTTGRKRE